MWNILDMVKHFRHETQQLRLENGLDQPEGRWPSKELPEDHLNEIPVAILQ